ncbi:MAG: hypothetical protein EON59_06060 [Alphaproteobacteria bacterium]|nr:MAG: hypothetical protein EON59_06060 [Alphaproteobacteria bacterium]
MRKDIDLRMEIAGDPSWVIFMGRSPGGGSVVGHAFVGFGSEDSSQQISWEQGFGLYPNGSLSGGASLLIGPVAGHLTREASMNSDVILSCRVSPSQFQKALALRDRWANTSSYELIIQDCVTFTFEVASLLGIKLPPRESVPDTIALPISLMTKTMNLNNTEDFSFGDWSSADPGRRWRLLLGAEDGTWTERNAQGGQIDAPTRVSRLGDRRFRIERDNNDPILTYLGARPSVRQELLARGVRPSYMILERTGADTFNADWYGVRWSLNAQNNLAAITQAGDAPPSSFQLKRRTS